MFVIIFTTLLLTIAGFILSKNLIKEPLVRAGVWLLIFAALCIAEYYAITKMVMDSYGVK